MVYITENYIQNRTMFLNLYRTIQFQNLVSAHFFFFSNENQTSFMYLNKYASMEIIFQWNFSTSVIGAFHVLWNGYTLLGLQGIMEGITREIDFLFTIICILEISKWGNILQWMTWKVWIIITTLFIYLHKIFNPVKCNENKIDAVAR